jgi:hypothetical protein
MNLAPILTLLLLLPTIEVRAEEAIDESTPAKAIASLTDPKKLATLKGERASNPRFQKCLYWLAIARAKGETPAYVIVSANLKNGQQATPYETFLLSSLTANLAEADKLGLLLAEGMNELRQGKSATITKGEYAGEEATADHYIPRSVCPELDNQIFNLRLLPSRLNSSKGDKVGEEQVKYAEELNKGGLLSAEGMEAVKKAYEKDIVPPPAPPQMTEQEAREKRDEETRQMELEMVRAEQKGEYAVYELWKERTTQQAERANESKSSKDVLIFERMVLSTMDAWRNSLRARGWKEADIRLGELDQLERLHAPLDKSLRAK